MKFSYWLIYYLVIDFLLDEGGINFNIMICNNNEDM